uniref:Uncharacterized protein n=1 Tax=viral metagenome TaxID=1070528 RepID=A0A6C0KC86_9ZZZZ
MKGANLVLAIETYALAVIGGLYPMYSETRASVLLPVAVVVAAVSVVILSLGERYNTAAGALLVGVPAVAVLLVWYNQMYKFTLLVFFVFLWFITSIEFAFDVDACHSEGFLDDLLFKPDCQFKFVKLDILLKNGLYIGLLLVSWAATRRGV